MSQRRSKALRKEARKVIGQVIPIEHRNAMYWYKRMPFKQRLKTAWKIIRGTKP